MMEAESACQLYALDPEPEQGSRSKATWVTETVEHQPAAGLMAILSRIQNDAKALESDILDQTGTADQRN